MRVQGRRINAATGCCFRPAPSFCVGCSGPRGNSSIFSVNSPAYVDACLCILCLRGSACMSGEAPASSRQRRNVPTLRCYCGCLFDNAFLWGEGGTSGRQVLKRRCAAKGFCGGSVIRRHAGPPTPREPRTKRIPLRNARPQAAWDANRG